MWVAPVVYFVVSLLLWKIGGGLFMPELLANRLFEIFPVPVIEFAVQLLGPLAKELAFYGIAIGYFGAYFLFARELGSHSTVSRQRLLCGICDLGDSRPHPDSGGRAGSVCIEISTGSTDAEPHAVCLALDFCAIAAVSAAFRLSLSSRKRDGASSLSRLGRRSSQDSFAVIAFFFKPAKWSDEVTATEDFYVVSKNSVDPVVPQAGWKLDVRGATQTTSYTMAQLRDLPSITMFATLACISNPVGGDWLGNARWTGVPLASLLQKAGVEKATRDVVIHAADGYTDSIPIERALQPLCFLAYEMNGGAAHHRSRISLEAHRSGDLRHEECEVDHIDRTRRFRLSRFLAASRLG